MEGETEAQPGPDNSRRRWLKLTSGFPVLWDGLGPRPEKAPHLPFPACQPLVPLALADVVGVPRLEGEPRHGPLAEAGLPAQATPQPAPGALGQRDDRQTGIKVGMDSPAAGSFLLEGKPRRHSPRTEHRSSDSWPEMPALECGTSPCLGGRSEGWRRDVGQDIKQEGKCLVLEWGPAGCLSGGLPTSIPTSSAPHGGTRTEGARGHLGLPSHTLATVGQSGGFLLLESGSTEPLGGEENTCLHFHGFDVGLLLFFACGEGRTKGLSAELQEWLRGLTLCLGSLPRG